MIYIFDPPVLTYIHNATKVTMAMLHQYRPHALPIKCEEQNSNTANFGIARCLHFHLFFFCGIFARNSRGCIGRKHLTQKYINHGFYTIYQLINT